MTAVTPADHARPGLPRRRRVDIEALRVLSIAGVVVIHATGSSIAIGTTDAGPSYWLALGFNAFSRFSVPLFFAIAGWAMLARTMADDETGWLRRRLVRLVVPLVLWSAIYLISDAARVMLSGPPPWAATDFVHWFSIKLQLVFYGPGVKGQLWFMYFLIPMTIVIWLVQAIPRPGPHPSAGGDVQRPFPWGYAITAAAFLGLFAAIALFHLRASWTGFGWTLAYAALGYVLLGTGRLGHPRAGLALYVGASAVILALGSTLGYNTWPFFNQAPTVAIAMVGLLLAAPTILRLEARPRWSELALRAGGLSYGVYFAHFLVLDWLRLVILRVDAVAPIPGPLKLVGLLVGTIVLTFALAAFWHRSRRATTLLG
jgi:surface polysaccharide O-acyltransferase-like enzyme